MTNEKSAQRDANTARTLAVVRFGHRPPARPPSRPLQTPESQTGAITIHCAAKLSMQCNQKYRTIIMVLQKLIFLIKTINQPH